MRTEQPGPLTLEERALLDALLAHEFPGVAELRVQALSALAKRGCTCGCGTIEFVLSGDDLPRSSSPSPAPAEAQVLNDDGLEVGGLLLFLEEGMLNSLEVYSYDEPIALPTVGQVRWDVIPCRVN